MKSQKNRYDNEKGVVAIYVAITMFVFIGIAVLAVDVGYWMVGRTELQRTADAAALAATRMLGRIYECDGNIVACPGPMPYQDQLVYVADAAAIRNASKDVAIQNQAGGSTEGIMLNDDDIVIGNWDASTRTLVPNLTSPDAVRVTSRRDGAANSPISTFFARVMGVNTVNVSATATAALTGQSEAALGGLPLPVGISKFRFENEYCEQDIKMYPTGTLDGCAGWHTYESSPANANKLAKMLEDLKDGTFQSPETKANESSFVFVGGTIASVFDEMKALFDYMKSRDDDGNPNTWTTSVVVYDWDDCSNPNKTIGIVGFATVVIHTVLEAPEKTIIATIKCDNVEPGRGGGGNYGTKGAIPGLVQ